MAIPISAIFVIIQIFFILLLLCGYLIYQIVKERKNSNNLTVSIQKLNSSLKSQKKALKQASREEKITPDKLYKEAINQQLEHTRDYHESLNSDSEISLDLSISAPIPCQTAALRNAFLVAERESAATSKDGTPNWPVLQGRFQSLLQFYQLEMAEKIKTKDAPPVATDPAEEILTLQNELNVALKKAEESERFRQLFTELEDRWLEAKDEVSSYHSQLVELISTTQDSNSFELVLNGYQDAFFSLETILAQSGDGKIATHQPSTAEERANKIITPLAKSLVEISHLKQVNAEQIQTISALKEKLKQAATNEEKEQAITSLSEALSRQEQFLAEADICIQQLETELSHSQNEIKHLSEQMEKMRANLSKIPELELLVKEFTLESRNMLNEIAAMEREEKKP